MKDYIVLTCAHDGERDWVMVRNIRRWGPCRASMTGESYLLTIDDGDGGDSGATYRETPEQIARLIDEARGAQP